MQKKLVMPQRKKVLESAGSGGDDIMCGTHYTSGDDGDDSNIDPLQVVDTKKEMGRRRRESFSEPKGKAVQRQTKSLSVMTIVVTDR